MRWTLLLLATLTACGGEPAEPACGPIGDYAGYYIRDKVLSDPSKRCPASWFEGMLPTQEYEGWETCITVKNEGCTQSWHLCPPAEMFIRATVTGVLTWEGHVKLSGLVSVDFAEEWDKAAATCLYRATYEQRP